jgi:hypothetical protein
MVGYTEQPDIALFVSGGFQPRRHAVCCQRTTSGGQRRIGLDEFLVQLSERHLIRPDFGSHGCDEACGEHDRGQK